VTDLGLGRRQAPDERDERFPVGLLLPIQASERRWRYWWTGGAWLDQGATGTCVGHAWGHYIEDGPVTHRGTIDPYGIYRDAVAVDEWPDNDHETTASEGRLQFGTSVRAGAKVLQRRGLISQYRWAFDLPTVVDTLLELGPVVAGTWWYESMFRPAPDGRVTVSGGRAGGHAYLLNGVNVDRRLVRAKNSWGREWGRDGSFWLTFDDLDRLIAEQGEACLALEVG
jgi:hypothetical protein